jgi:hypothetical protein
MEENYLLDKYIKILRTARKLYVDSTLDNIDKKLYLILEKKYPQHLQSAVDKALIKAEEISIIYLFPYKYYTYDAVIYEFYADAKRMQHMYSEEAI